MALSDFLSLISLVSLNVIIYAVAVAGLVRARQMAFRPSDSARSFMLLERSLKRAFPDLPDGFTWREAMHRVEELDLNVDWAEVEKALKQYEGWRYGEMVKPEDVNAEVVRLARELARRGRRWPAL